MGFAFGAAFLFSVSSVSGRKAVAWAGSPRANLWRQCLAVLFLAIYAHGFGGGFRGAALSWFLVSGLIGYGLGDTSIYCALPLLGSRLTSLMTQCLAAPIAALIEWLWHGTVLHANQAWACFMILFGVGLALAPSPGATPTHRLPTKGIIFGFLAAVGQAGGAVLSRYGSSVTAAAGLPVDGMTVAYQRLWPGVCVAVIWFLTHRQLSQRDETQVVTRVSYRKAWPWILTNSIAGPTLGVGSYQRALQLLPTAVVLPIVALSPLMVVPLAWIFERERPTGRSLFGGLIAVVGVCWLTGADKLIAGWFR